MLANRARCLITVQCRQSSTVASIRRIPTLKDADITTFRQEAFEPSLPFLLPKSTFTDTSAVSKWFKKGHRNKIELNASYLSRFGSTVVPLEITHGCHFNRIEQSLSFFFECVFAASGTYFIPPQTAQTSSDDLSSSASTLTAPTAQIYLAQAPLADLPRALRDDVPMPEIVLKAGKGDVYDSSLWMGLAPTYTPLHRDPNPNLFLQLAGRKIVRILAPEAGRAVFAKVQEKIGGEGSATMRGEEMMQGAERAALEEEVWGEDGDDGMKARILEGELESGDALFIPKGWWHSIKGVGEGMNGSVNWWFR